MTPPLCKVCLKPLDEHEDREFDVCVAKALGWKEIRPYAIINRGWYGINLSGNLQVVPHYSTDIRDATPLWKDDWVLEKVSYGDNETRIKVWNKRDYLGFKQIASPLAIAETLEVALCHATLIEGVKGKK